VHVACRDSAQHGPAAERQDRHEGAQTEVKEESEPEGAGRRGYTARAAGCCAGAVDDTSFDMQAAL
jgi:hypothetical protein